MSNSPELPRQPLPSLQEIFDLMLRTGASDLHLKAGSPPGLRVHGQLRLLTEFAPLSDQDTRRIAAELLPPERRESVDQLRDLDFSYDVAGVSRYRVSLLRQRGTLSVVMRRIPAEIPDIDRLGIPEIAKRMALQHNGLVLVTGPTGSGKSTTLAALLNYLNMNRSLHIVTMEDPIEFVHRDRNCLITQREIGRDCDTFGQALRRALRQDPDVIMIGELRDRETMQLALTAAETGHLVFATLHTTGAMKTVDRILDAFPSEVRDQIRMQLSGTLRGVVSQTLVPGRTGACLAAVEVMVMNEAIRSCIREGKTHQIQNLIQTGSTHGMRTMTASLAELVRRGSVDRETALERAPDPDELEKAIATGLRPLRQRKVVEPMPEGRAPGTAPRAPSTEGRPVANPGAALPVEDLSTDQILERLRRS